MEGFVRTVKVRKDVCSGDGTLSPRVALALRYPGQLFHTVWGGIDSEDHRLLLRFVGVVEVRKNFWSGDETLSFPRGVGFTNPGLGLPHRAGGHRPGGPPISSPVCSSFRGMEGFLIGG